ncbi:MAG TPA: cbb3-type cytochrome c oxidase subunit II, partial [Candidatus Binatia bacterium]|nr:cbb3-type cytochrome c oxidase subunit II [Candidatus Binatia bacterium]
YLRDYPVQLGNLRLGPDLVDYGARQTNAMLVLMHLYSPQKTMPGSMMPPYRYLFSKQTLAQGQSRRAGALPATLEPGYEIMPRPEAEALAAYLLSLQADAPLPEAPAPTPPSKTAPPESTATNAISTSPGPAK